MPDDEFRERQLAQLLITLYCCGSPTVTLLEGETRRIDSLQRLQRFDFWMREPAHLALALLYACQSTSMSTSMPPSQNQRDLIQAAIARMLSARQLDVRRVRLMGASHKLLADLNHSLAILTSCALITERPSFAKNQLKHQTTSTQIVLERSGIAVVEQILATAPTFAWYRAQGEIIAACADFLDAIDLQAMPYLSPDLKLADTITRSLTTVVWQRALAVFPTMAEQAEFATFTATHESDPPSA